MGGERLVDGGVSRLGIFVDVGDGDQGDGAIGLGHSLLHGVDAQDGVRVGQESGAVQKSALSAHRHDRGLRARVGRGAHVGGQAEGRLGRFRDAAADGYHRVVLAGQLADDAVGGVAVSREDAEAVVTLGGKARQKLVLKVLLPVGRHFERAFAEVEVSLGVHDRLPHRFEVRVRAAGDDGNRRRCLASPRGGPSARGDEHHGCNGQCSSQGSTFHRLPPCSSSTKLACICSGE